MKGLQSKVAVVTGGAHGIGAAACRRLAEEGARVAVTDLDDAAGEELAAAIRADGGTAVYHRLDVTDEQAVAQVFSSVREQWGSLDVLVNNAGIAGVNASPEETTAEDWRKVLDVNVMGVFHCTKHAVGAMREAGGGSIVNLSSIYGIIGAPDIPPYHASKGAVREMTKTDAMFFAGNGIRVNSVHPGFIWTPLVEELAENAPQSVEEFRRELDSRHPIGHVGQPEDVASGIAFLASEDARFMTGSELVVDGGYTAQ